MPNLPGREIPLTPPEERTLRAAIGAGSVEPDARLRSFHPTNDRPSDERMRRRLASIAGKLGKGRDFLERLVALKHTGPHS